jgi:hypothetical protein
VENKQGSYFESFLDLLLLVSGLHGCWTLERDDHHDKLEARDALTQIRSEPQAVRPVRRRVIQPPTSNSDCQWGNLKDSDDDDEKSMIKSRKEVVRLPNTNGGLITSFRFLPDAFALSGLWTD